MIIILGNASLFTTLLFTILVPLNPPTSQNSEVMDSLLNFEKGPQTELRTRQDCEQTLGKLCEQTEWRTNGRFWYVVFWSQWKTAPILISSPPRNHNIESLRQISQPRRQSLYLRTKAWRGVEVPPSSLSPSSASSPSALKGASLLSHLLCRQSHQAKAEAYPESTDRRNCSPGCKSLVLMSTRAKERVACTLPKLKASIRSRFHASTAFFSSALP